MPFNARINCISRGYHAWSSMAGGYLCLTCRQNVTDTQVAQLRSQNYMGSLNEMLEYLSTDNEHWLAGLHMWSVRDEEL